MTTLYIIYLSADFKGNATATKNLSTINNTKVVKNLINNSIKKKNVPSKVYGHGSFVLKFFAHNQWKKKEKERKNQMKEGKLTGIELFGGLCVFL